MSLIDKLISAAESLISQASALVGGRVIYLDCKDALINHYSRFGYQPLYFDEKTQLHKLYKVI